MTNKIYSVKLLPSNISGANSTMWRAGRLFIAGETLQLELSDEDLGVFENDWRFEVSDSADTSKKNSGGNVGKSKTIPSSSNVAGTETVVDTTEVVEDISVAQEKTFGSKSKKKS